MSLPVEDILQEALQLSESERGKLAAKLIESLDSTKEEEADAAWSLEISQRLEELERGSVQPVPWLEARRLIQETLYESASA